MTSFTIWIGGMWITGLWIACCWSLQALSAFGAKFISPQSKNSKVTLKGQCLKIV